jgi:GMP synthase-like glutamine amidotransferase
MRVHHFRHVEFENLGSIEAWLESAGHSVTTTRMYAHDPLPTVDQFDWLIVMGGPMSANDDATLPWMGPEKQVIRQAIDAGKRVMGVCLGSQLIAACLGAKVYQNPQREIGWFDIQRSSEASQHPFGAVFPPRTEVFHWHGDTFDLPPGAIRLASSAACLNQAYAISNRVLGLQFHLEMTPFGAEQLTVHCRDELGDAPYVQTPEKILADPSHFTRINQLMSHVLQTMADAPAVSC